MITFGLERGLGGARRPGQCALCFETAPRPRAPKGGAEGDQPEIIRVDSTVALVGGSGSGKSTIIQVPAPKTPSLLR